MVEVSLTVGKLDASLAVLLTQDHHLIEFPTVLLPNGVKGGSIVKIKCEHDLDAELEEKKRFQSIQDEIYTMFGKSVPRLPILSVKNVTQTSCVLQWEPLDLGTASFKSLVLYRDDSKLFSVPNPLSSRTTKLSGLAIDKSFKFQLRLDTTAGIYMSEKIEITTHKMTDLSGINVCVQDIGSAELFSIDDINLALKNMGAHYPAHDKMRVETTHYITTRENKENPEFIKANEMNVPIVRPEWLKACERERRIVGVLNFYVKECAMPTILAENYWSTPENRNKASGPGLVSNTSPQQTASHEESPSIPEVQITELSDTEDTTEKLSKAEEITIESGTEPTEGDEKVEDAKPLSKDLDEKEQISSTETKTEYPQRKDQQRSPSVDEYELEKLASLSNGADVKAEKIEATPACAHEAREATIEAGEEQDIEERKGIIEKEEDVATADQQGPQKMIVEELIEEESETVEKPDDANDNLEIVDLNSL